MPDAYALHIIGLVFTRFLLEFIRGDPGLKHTPELERHNKVIYHAGSLLSTAIWCGFWTYYEAIYISNLLSANEYMTFFLLVDWHFLLCFLTMALLFFCAYHCFTALDKYYTKSIGVFPDHQLKTTGVYTMILHPGYGLEVLATIVYACMLNVSFLSATIIVVITMTDVQTRLGVEETYLSAELEGYDDYAKERWRFVPYVRFTIADWRF